MKHVSIQLSRMRQAADVWRDLAYVDVTFNMNKEQAVVAVLTLVDSCGRSIIGAIAIGLTEDAELTVLLLKESGICVEGSSTTIIHDQAAQFNKVFAALRQEFPRRNLNDLLCTLHFLYEFKGGIRAKLCRRMTDVNASSFQDTANDLILKVFDSEVGWQKKLDEALARWPCTCCNGPRQCTCAATKYLQRIKELKEKFCAHFTASIFKGLSSGCDHGTTTQSRGESSNSFLKFQGMLRALISRYNLSELLVHIVQLSDAQ